MKKTIALVVTLDTKGEESRYVKDLIEQGGYKVIVIDVGTGARGSLLFHPDIPRERVAEAAGVTMEEILALGKKGKEMKIMELMASGGANIVKGLHASGELDGMISIGGTMGTHLGTTIMRALPFGVPKVMLSTVASGDTRPYIGTADITMIPSVADIAGLNRITETSLSQAAAAVMGMAAIGEVKPSDRPLIGITTLGGTTACALYVKRFMEEKGYEVAIFHSGSGIGGRAMEEMIEQGLISAVFDLSTNEVVDNLYGGFTDVGPSRLEAAGKKGIPQVVAPGNVDHIMYTSADLIPDRFKHQKVHVHGPRIHVLRTKKKEIMEVGKAMADKLNKAVGPTVVIFPKKGLSILDITDPEIFKDPESDLALLEVWKQDLKPEIEILELDVHITDERFAEEAAGLLYRLMQQGKETG
jgi:uncharacterized protein (UPF0261 family)